MATVKITALPDGAHHKAGAYDNAKRWYPKPEFKVYGSFCVRSPSRSWPYNYLKHFYTTKYSRLLFKAKPRLWLEINGISPEAPEAGPYIAAHAEGRM